MSFKTSIIIIAVLLPMTIYSQQYSEQNSETDRSVENRIETLLSQMTLAEKISMLHGNSKFTTAGVERLGIPPWRLSDGPHGIREEIKPHTWEPAGWTTDSSSYFPTGTALAATWNPVLAEKMGIALGEEARARNKDVLLGPGVNILRTPLCGRNFEYMGEDPLLVSEMAIQYIRGVQSQDVAACLKHYALNNQEYERFKINVEVDERTLREIYLPAFKAAVKKADVFTIMGAYNKFRGKYCCENHYLLNDILKGEWDFKGAVVSDWDATHSTIESANAGLDLEMGTAVDDYKDYYFADALQKAVEDGEVAEAVVDDKVRRILRVMFRTRMIGSDDRKTGAFNTPEHQALTRKIAEEALVLLKNAGNLLPLDKTQIKSIAVIGDNATRKHAAGGVSSGLKALYEITPLEGLQKYLKDDVKITYARGYQKTSEFHWDKGAVNTPPDPEEAAALIAEAVNAAKAADVAIIFGGLNHDYDTEAFDRPDMKLPYTQNELIEAVQKANPKTIVVLICGSPVEMDRWVNRVPAIVQGWYAGMEGGTAMAKILFGDVNFSGKLPFTFPKKLADSPPHKIGEYPGKNLTVEYKEGILVGYRYFDTENVEPLFCFGHGLSYTNFSYSDLKLSSAAMLPADSIQVQVTVKNTGHADGAEVVQLYLRDVESSVLRPAKELKGFRKIFLKAGESGKVTFKLSRADLAFYDVSRSDWVSEPGAFRVLIGSSSRDIRMEGAFELLSE